jgi:Family of unknown function (DUF5681)
VGNPNIVEVGKATRFRKGQSGNPGGKRKTRPLSEALLRNLHSRDPATRALRLELVVRCVVDHALAGDPNAWRLLWEYIDGRPPQFLEHSGPEGGPVQLLVARVDARLADARDPPR